MDRLRRSRGVLQAASTRLISSAAKALQAEHPSMTDLQVVSNDLQDMVSTLAAVDEKVADLLTDGEEYEEEATARRRPRSSRVTGTDTQGVSTRSSPREPLRVPVFSGELREWWGFWEHYELVTIRNNHDEACGRGGHLEQANYAVAVKMLQERFGRHVALADERIDSLLAIAPVDRSSQLSQQRQLYEEVRFRPSCLDSLCVLASCSVVIFHRVFMRSLPGDLAVLERQRMK
ncbi:hypothetical protein HPB50_024484 [Hyalomma asiaticum]|uniref:Uncharacterized protein n=1 Tax=Hyalomma asiaticum TaxID=266040 RepID=A0ACB7SZK6_HYAAI|nr:hypothetical protein HPB50_024484 [Hyalomma asiaticum]